MVCQVLAFSRSSLGVCAALLLAGWSSSWANATPISPGTVVPLYSLGTYTDSQGAVYSNADIHPAGEGVFQPFERIHSAGNAAYEQGFNTDSKTFQLDNLTKGAQTWNHSVLLSDIAKVTFNGTQYYEFDLNINQTGNSGSYESLDKVQIFQTSTPDITNYVGASPSDGSATDNFYDKGAPLATKVYDEDMGAAGDTTINLNSRLNNGQGDGTADMTLLVPTALFTGNQQYVVLYSAFGDPNAKNHQTSSTPGFFPVDGGKEQWRYNDTPSPVPLPSTANIGLALFAGLGTLIGIRKLAGRRSIA